MAIQVGVNDLVEVRMVCHCANQVGINVHHLLCNATKGAGQTYDQVAKFLSNNLAAKYKASLAVEAAFDGVGTRRIRPEPPTAFTYYTGDTGPGVVTGGVLPPQTAGLITRRTVFGGPSYRGRMYIPFPGSSHMTTSGRPSLTYQTNLGLIATYLLGSIQSGTLDDNVTLIPVIFSRVHNSTQTVSSTAVQGFFASQRRRSFATQGDFILVGTGP